MIEISGDNLKKFDEKAMLKMPMWEIVKVILDNGGSLTVTRIPVGWLISIAVSRTDGKVIFVPEKEQITVNSLRKKAGFETIKEIDLDSLGKEVEPLDFCGVCGFALTISVGPFVCPNHHTEFGIISDIKEAAKLSEEYREGQNG